MSHYKATTQGADLGLGMAFVIHSGALRRGDIVEIEMVDGDNVHAIIERFDPAGLYINIESRKLQCRPWQKGDAETEWLRGTISKWTVEKVIENAATEAAA